MKGDIMKKGVIVPTKVGAINGDGQLTVTINGDAINGARLTVTRTAIWNGVG